MNPNYADDFAKILREHRNLAILRFLHNHSNYSTNDNVLKDVLNAVGLQCGADVLSTQIRQLEDLGAISVRKQDDKLVVTLTNRGEEAAQGIIFIDGIKKPGPECSY